MSDGGPYPATGHPDFTSVGLPATMRDHNPTGQLWRSIDGAWTQADVAA